MKNTIITTIAAVFALTSVAATAAPTLDSGIAEYKGKVAKTCEVGNFRAGTIVIRDGEDGRVISSKQGKAATFVVRGNSRSITLHFGDPRIEIRRNDGVSGFTFKNRKTTYDSTVTARKNNNVTSSNKRKIDIASVGSNDVSLDITITDTNKNSMIPAGTYRVFVPVTCTK